eukprot:CAMPEP_0194158864 /NCGR_PEP_ID=MMETSP0152-20130528/77514_1 /TAXON_ID=1049557 /ORGANISM="Thalassiothrix antarctica, Strain L6-D1" /LENGTH=627 /DNA_ID=CAMNT_0038868369 /DNA_START=90 /DNA_END=1973 /DNA_ORIENTATION=+
MYDQNSYPAYEGAPPSRRAPATSSKAKMRARSPVYAIDFSAQAAGKRIATTKRRIRWRWGYTNQEALTGGKIGTECRGEEHDVILVWSVTSGKRQILMDGKEVHFSSSRSSIIDFSWTTKGNHVMKLSAHASPPMSASQINSTFRQYDLLVDGQSYFSMPKVFELGLRGDPQGQARSPGRYKEPQDDIKRQEEEDLQRAIRHSIAESRAHLAEKNRTDDNSSTGYNDGYAGNSGGYNENYAAPPPAQMYDQSTTMGMEFTGLGLGNSAPPPTYDTLNYAPAPGTYPPAPGTYPPAPGTYPPAPGTYPPAPGTYPSAPAPANYPPAPATYPAAVPANYPPAPATYPAAPAPLAIAYPGHEPPPAAPPPGVFSFETPPAQNIGYNSVPPTPVAVTSGHIATGQLLSPTFSTASAPPNYANNYYPTQPVDDPFAPKAPTKDEVHSAVLGLYGTPNPNIQPNPAGPVAPPPNFVSPENGAVTNNINLTMNAALPITNEDEPLNEFDSALQHLVNIDDINAPANAVISLSMVNEEEEKKRKKNEGKGRSTAIPPLASGMIGTHATLSQISDVKTVKDVADPTKIMKPVPQNVMHQNGGHAGALVVHGQGPPPLQQGFGVGYGQGYHGAQAGY